MAENDTSIRATPRSPEDQSPSADPREVTPALAPGGGSLGTTIPNLPAAGWTDDQTVISKRPPLAAATVPAPSSSLLLGTALAGTQLEHYVLDEFVGGGGMGAVFRATDTRLGRTVAVKVLSRDHTDEETIRRFRNEAQSAARLDHPNIARVYYVGEDRGWNFIVFEFIEGTNLRDEIEQFGPLDLERALHDTLQVAEALAHSSGRDIVHRDIKPSNVLVTATGQVKLVDMGLARVHQMESSTGDLTASGVMLGTFDYISPEQARDPRAADVRSDIYSLGCTLFYMLCGQPPFPEGTAVQKLLQHNSDEPPDIRAFRPELSPRVSALVAKMLAKRPAQRQQSPEELIAEIVGLGRHLGFKSVAEFGRIVILPARRPESWWGRAGQVAGAVALLAIALVVLDLAMSPAPAGGDSMPRAQFKPSAEAPAVVASPDAAGPATLAAPPPIAGESATGAGPPATSLRPDNNMLRAGRVEPRTLPGTFPGAPLAESPQGPGPPAAAETNTRGEPGDVAVSPVVEQSAPQRIVVLGDMSVPLEPQTVFAATLGEACGLAAELGVTEIELRFSGPRIEAPLEIASQRLTVRAAADQRPQIVFRPPVQLGETHMIKLSGGSLAQVHLEGLDLRLELPADAPADGWALFGMSTGQALELTSCVLTVQDGAALGTAIHDQSAFVAVQRRRSGETMTMGDVQLAMGQQARINLERTIARGEASLVNLTDETPLTIRWNQGLLITSQHLIETGGSASEPQYYEQLVLDLHNVTAYCRAGLYYLRRGPGKAFQFHINAYSDRCLFISEPGVPLFEMVGLAAPPEDDELQSTGEGNRFSPPDMPFLVIRSTAGGEPQAFKLGRRWSSEPRSQAGVLWTHAPPLDQPLHALTKYDFEAAAGAAGGVGFTAALLPEAASAPWPGGSQPLQPLSIPLPPALAQ